jgi:hypothetical protein
MNQNATKIFFIVVGFLKSRDILMLRFDMTTASNAPRDFPFASCWTESHVGGGLLGEQSWEI